MTGDRLTYRVDGLLNYRSDKGLLAAVLAGDEERREVDDSDAANLVSSRSADGKHRPVIDLDVPHRLVPSSTEGHGHLYLDVPMSWSRYVVLLAALRFAGVIERGFFWWAMRRGATFARLPHVKKDTA